MRIISADCVHIVGNLLPYFVIVHFFQRNLIIIGAQCSLYRKFFIRVVYELVPFGYTATVVRIYQTAIVCSSGNGDDDDGDGSSGGLADLHLQTPAHRLG